MTRKLTSIVAILVAALGMAFTTTAIAATSSDSADLIARGGTRLKIKARMGSKDATQAKSVYQERTRNAKLAQRFKVSVEDGTPGAEMAVSVNGIFVGNVIIDDLGRGTLQFRTVVDDPGDGVPIPDGFPRLAAGDTVDVGALSGVYR